MNECLGSRTGEKVITIYFFLFYCRLGLVGQVRTFSSELGRLGQVLVSVGYELALARACPFVWCGGNKTRPKDTPKDTTQKKDTEEKEEGASSCKEG